MMPRPPSSYCMPTYGGFGCASICGPRMRTLSNTTLRYCTPELLPLTLNSTSSSKSRTSPFQMRNVLCGAGFAAVVRPTTSPLSTDQNFGS